VNLHGSELNCRKTSAVVLSSGSQMSQRVSKQL
jgi:hypothetical protein